VCKPRDQPLVFGPVQLLTRSSNGGQGKVPPGGARRRPGTAFPLNHQFLLVESVSFEEIEVPYHAPSLSNTRGQGIPLLRKGLLMDKTFKEIVGESLKVIRAFQQVEKRPWGVEGAVIELSKQVGELAKHIMMFEGYYLAGRDKLPEYQTSKAHIADELSDILFIVIRIADHYGIALEEEHLKQLDIALQHPHMKIRPGREFTEERS